VVKNKKLLISILFLLLFSISFVFANEEFEAANETAMVVDSASIAETGNFNENQEEIIETLITADTTEPASKPTSLSPKFMRQIAAWFNPKPSRTNNSVKSEKPLFDWSNISAQLKDKNGNVIENRNSKGEIIPLNGWIVMGMGMFIAFSCLLLIMAIVKYLPFILKFLDYIAPPKVSEETKSAQDSATDTANDTIAAAIAVAFHNYNNDGK